MARIRLTRRDVGVIGRWPVHFRPGALPGVGRLAHTSVNPLGAGRALVEFARPGGQSAAGLAFAQDLAPPSDT
jgi:hypothetical protein